MRILFLATDAFGGYGGIAKFNRDFLRALCNASEVTEVLAVPRRMPHPPEPLPPKLTYIVSGLDNKLLYVKTLLNLWKKYRKIDIIYCAHIHLLSVAYLLKLFFNAKIVLILHGVDAWQPTKSWFNNYLAGKVDAIITVSDITKERFIKWADIEKARIFLLPNAIEVKEYGPGPKSIVLLEKYGLSGKVILMTLGRLSSEEKYKSFDEIMELLPELSKNIPDIAYLVVGDGDDRPRLEAKARALGVEDRVVITGFVPEPEKADHFRLADTFVMPGRGEGFGIVFLEAMACGIPVVGSTIDGSREALRYGTLGILVDPRHPDEIKAGILEALKRPRGIIPAGLDYFSFENFENRCLAILREVGNLKKVKKCSP
jgi:phosphatidylinositol alpha-1,6-mannosyltransferase